MKRSRTLLAATVAACLSLLLVTAAQAQTAAPTPAPEPPPSAAPAIPPAPMPPPTPATPEAMPPPTVATPTQPAPDALPPPGQPPTLRNPIEYPRPTDLSYGVAMRFRWVSVPASMLNVFTKKNVPLGFRALPGAWAIEGFRRKQNFDITASVGYQAMSPDDGNWLGTGKDPSVDTDYVQFRSFGFFNVDISFIWHTMFTDWIGLHYGAGLGVGIMHGQILRTSDWNQCTAENAGDPSKCHPNIQNLTCSTSGCPDKPLADSMGAPGTDDPATPHRFADPNVPSVIPIINAVIGIDFRVPSLRGWEAKIEGGFFDALFVGGGIGYTF